MADKTPIYKRLILKELYFSKSTSCAMLSSRINKSLMLTTKILNELLEEGSVIETGLAPSSGGRRPVMYSVKPDVMNIVAVAMDQRVTRISIVNMDQQNVQPVVSFSLHLADNPKALSILVKKIKEVIEMSGLTPEKLVGIGIAMPGFVDVSEGVNYSFLDAKGSSITEFVYQQTGLPVYIDNDSSMIALAELRFGAAMTKKNAMVLNINWGIGLGLILNRELFRGYNGFAGEF